MTLEMIAFDADDTLWHAEINFLRAQDRFKQLLSPWLAPEKSADILYEIEMRNLPKYGYGTKSFTLSMLEAALKISVGQINGKIVEEILAIGASILEADVTLFPHVFETIQTLAREYRLMVITKGDLLEQTAKLNYSGLADYFTFFEVVSDKTTPVYQNILNKYQLNPKGFLMIGNSLRSDIIPVLELGAKAIHIPAEITWTHEMVTNFDPGQEGYYHAENIGQLKNIIPRL